MYIEYILIFLSCHLVIVISCVSKEAAAENTVDCMTLKKKNRDTFMYFVKINKEILYKRTNQSL